jgi:site-specific recombinase XerD
MKDSDQATDPLDEIKLVTNPSENRLNERQYLDYRSEREHCLDWLLTFGKEPEKAEGYATTTVKNRASRMDQFYRWVWEQEDGYTSNLTHEHADDYLRYLAGQEKSNAHKNACRKAVMMLYKWRHHQRGADPWEPEITFSRKNKSTAPGIT